jgi:hypothetical protein
MDRSRRVSNHLPRVVHVIRERHSAAQRAEVGDAVRLRGGCSRPGIGKRDDKNDIDDYTDGRQEPQTSDAGHVRASLKVEVAAREEIRKPRACEGAVGLAKMQPFFFKLANSDLRTQ